MEYREDFMVFGEELDRLGLVYSHTNVNNVLKGTNFSSMYFIAKKPGLLKRVFGDGSYDSVGDIVSNFFDYEHSCDICPLRIEVINQKYAPKLREFAKSYRDRTGREVELIIDDGVESSRAMK
ncbi:MAG: hypothetical protein Q7S27_04985 [Nanoarchaeota archaeon]|nr:hypothetical protein [Nanoarchaeota archaeon]